MLFQFFPSEFFQNRIENYYIAIVLEKVEKVIKIQIKREMIQMQIVNTIKWEQKYLATAIERTQLFSCDTFEQIPNSFDIYGRLHELMKSRQSEKIPKRRTHLTSLRKNEFH